MASWVCRYIFCWALCWPLLAQAEDEAIFHGDNLALVDLVYERQIIGDGLDLYVTDDQVFVPLSPLARALEVESQVSADYFVIKMPSGTMLQIAKKEMQWFMHKGGDDAEALPAEPLPEGSVHFYDGFLFTTPEVIQQFLSVNLELDFAESALHFFIDGVALYPFQERLARQQRDAPGQSLMDESSFPRIKPHYEWVEVPSIDLRLNQATTRYEDDKYEDVSATYYTARTLGDFLGMSTESFISGIRDEGLTAATIRMERFDSQRQLLGPLQLSQVSIGDMVYPSLPLTPSTYGRGMIIGNETVRGDSQQDVQSIEGDYFPGWEVELYLNGALIGYQVIGDDGHYAFKDVVLFSGQNNFILRFYGPNGQQDELNRQIVLGEQQAKKRRLTYSLSISQPDQTMIDVADENIREKSDDYRAVFNSKITLLDRLFLNVGFQNESISQELELDDQPADYTIYQQNDYSYFNTGFHAYIGSNRLSFHRVEEQDGPVNYRADLGGFALYTRYQLAYERYDEEGAFGGVVYSDTDNFRRYKTDFSMNTRLGSTSAIYRTLYEDFSRGFSREHRLGVSGKVWRLSWSSNLRYQKTVEELSEESRVTEDMSGATFFGLSMRPVNIRITSAYVIEPEAELTSVGLVSAMRLDSKTNVDFSINKSLIDDSVLSRLGLSWAHESFRVTPSVAYSNKGYWQGQVQLSATLGKRQGRLGNYYKLGSDPTLSHGAARLRLYEDDNGDGEYQRGEKLLSGGEIHAVQARRKARSNGAGIAWLESMQPWEPTDIVVNENMLDDGYMSLAIDEYAIVPRPGQVITVDMPFVRVGEIDGRVTMVDGDYELPANGIPIGLVNAAGEQIAEHYTDSEGYFTFARVEPGRYQFIAPNNEILSSSHQTVDISRKGEYISGIEISIKMKSFNNDLDWLESLDDQDNSQEKPSPDDNNSEKTAPADNNLSEELIDVPELDQEIFVETFALPPAPAIEHTVLSEAPVESSKETLPVEAEETPEASQALPTPSNERFWALQVGSFSQPASAQAVVEKLREQGFGASVTQVTVKGREFHRVFAQGFLDKDSALAAKSELDRTLKTRSILTQM